MKLRTLLIGSVAIAAAALAGCDREPATPETSPRASAPPPAGPVTRAPSTDADRGLGQTTSDAGITAKVKAALLAEKDISGTDINVDTMNGNVTLTGKVTSAAEAERATQVARAVEGVKAVDNKLTSGAG